MSWNQNDKSWLTGILLLAVLMDVTPGTAQEFSKNPNRSFYVNVSLGGGFDLDRDARSPLNHVGEYREAYSIGAFLIGIRVGYRFNEYWGVEGGWHDQQHRAHSEWGGRAGYMMGAWVLRMALPLSTRQTPVLKLGPAAGRFSYGSASYGRQADNDTVVVGGEVGLALEHELVLGIVATLELSYAPMYRLGMDGVLILEETSYTDTGMETRMIGSKDFTDGQVVHLLWITAGMQFEWTFR